VIDDEADEGFDARPCRLAIASPRVQQAGRIPRRFEEGDLVPAVPRENLLAINPAACTGSSVKLRPYRKLKTADGLLRIG